MMKFPMSDKLRERFCKECKIPINIYTEPFFSSRLALLNPLYDALEKWNRFVDSLQKYPSEQAYFEDYNRIKDETIDFIKNAKGYQEFNSEDMNQYAVKHKGLPNKDIYKPSNDGEMFISIDMQKANFSALKYYNAEIFDNAETWEAFMRKFTDNEHIINSKYIRQVVLGNCNPKRHITYEKYLMDKVIDLLENDSILKEHGLSLESIVFFSNDEVVVDVSKINMHPGQLLQRIANLVADYFCTNISFHVDLFRLKKIEGLSGGYIKDSTLNRCVIKGVSSEMMPFVVRKLKSEEITDEDKTFYHNGLLAKYIKIPDIAV